MAESFPKQPPPPPAWLSEIPSRSYQSGGTYKHHRNLGHAKNAILATNTWRQGYQGGKIYKWDFEDNVWDLIYTVEPGTKDGELPWQVEG